MIRFDTNTAATYIGNLFNGNVLLCFVVPGGAYNPVGSGSDDGLRRVSTGGHSVYTQSGCTR